MLTDSHCHLSELSEDDLKTTLDRAKQNGVTTLIAIGAGYDVSGNEKTLKIAKQHDHIFCTLGIHPHDAKKVTFENFIALEKLICENKKVVGVGEIGLDYCYLNSAKDVQQDVLRRFAKLAKKVGKPVMIHDRDSGFDCVDILQHEGLDACGGVAHCFTGSKELAQRYLDLGFLISFSGIITFKNAQAVRDVVRFVPLEKILIETDSPFLAPVPFRGKPNEPAYVKFVAEKVAEIKGKTFQTVCEVTSQNCKNLFRL